MRQSSGGICEDISLFDLVWESCYCSFMRTLLIRIEPEINQVWKIAQETAYQLSYHGEVGLCDVRPCYCVGS